MTSPNYKKLPETANPTIQYHEKPFQPLFYSRIFKNNRKNRIELKDLEEFYQLNWAKKWYIHFLDLVKSSEFNLVMILIFRSIMNFYSKRRLKLDFSNPFLMRNHYIGRKRMFFLIWILSSALWRHFFKFEGVNRSTHINSEFKRYLLPYVIILNVKLFRWLVVFELGFFLF